MKAEAHHKKQLLDKYNECLNRLVNELIQKRTALIITVSEWDFKKAFLEDRTFFTETAEMAFLKDVQEFKDSVEAEYYIMKNANSILDKSANDDEE